MKESIAQLRELEKQLFAYNFAMATMGYDGETVAPAGGTEGRAVAFEVLSKACFDMLINDKTDALLRQAELDAETEQEKAEVRELRHEYDDICKIPADEYAAFSRLTEETPSVWAKAKRTNDFASYAPYLERVVDALKRHAHYAAPDMDPYDYLLNRYERGLNMEQLDKFFSQLRETIVPLLADIQARGKKLSTDFIDNNVWPTEQQKKLDEVIMNIWGLDKDVCALGVTEHPFTSDFWRKDVRITTHYYENDFTSDMYSIAHEGGHALYALGSAPELDFTCLGGGASMSLHESQSRLFENYVARSRSFVEFIWPTLLEIFPEQLKDVTVQQFYEAVNIARPDFIRTQADELTYSLHVMVRYELEKQLMHGELEVKDLPAAWNAKYKEYLGVDVPNDTVGVLQDIHWSQGSIGYFPSYALGNAYGAQAMDDIRKTMDVDAVIASGDLTPLKEELRNRLWKYSRVKEPAELVKILCGGEFDPSHYTEYLKKKYTELYGL